MTICIARHKVSYTDVAKRGVEDGKNKISNLCETRYQKVADFQNTFHTHQMPAILRSNIQGP